MEVKRRLSSYLFQRAQGRCGNKRAADSSTNGQTHDLPSSNFTAPVAL